MALAGIDGNVEFLPPLAPRRFVAAERLSVSLDELCMELGARSADGDGQRRVAVPGVRVDTGPLTQPRVLGGDGTADAALVLRGLILADTKLAGRTATQIFGPGDMVPLGGDPDSGLGRGPDLRVAQTATLVPLDARFAMIGRRWPEVGSLVVQAAARQLARGATHQAISQLSRIELRLLAMMWYLADRWGRVTPSGLVLELDLTHTMLGQLVGAKRPTVSLALKVLAQDRTLVRRDHDWLLDRDSYLLLEDQSALPRTALSTVDGAATA